MMKEPLSVAAALHGEDGVQTSLDFSMSLTRSLIGRNLNSAELLPVGSTVLHLTNPHKRESLFIFLERPVGNEITESWSPSKPVADAETGVIGHVFAAVFHPSREEAELTICLRDALGDEYQLTYRSEPRAESEALPAPSRRQVDCLDNIAVSSPSFGGVREKRPTGILSRLFSAKA